MIDLKLAGLRVRLHNHYDAVETLCRDYRITTEGRPDIEVEASERELDEERALAPELPVARGYTEEVVLYEKLSCELPRYDAFVMHSSVVAVDGCAFCFAAEPGTGKSTHTRYWKELLGDRVTVINGDKPIYRFRDGELHAFGTPWCGKEGWNTNTSAPLKGLCLLERADENRIEQVDAFPWLDKLMKQFYLPGGRVDTLRVVELIDHMLELVPVYRLAVRNELSAAETAARVLLQPLSACGPLPPKEKAVFSRASLHRESSPGVHTAAEGAPSKSI